MISCRRTAALGAAHLAAAALLLAGCASPGPPRAPSLQLPAPVHDLTASRAGNAVTLRFTLPQRTTDNLPIREAAVRASLCFAPEGAPCTVVPSLQNVELSLPPAPAAGQGAASARTITWIENLPPADTTGTPRLLAFRVQLSNLRGRSAGWSEPAYTASGLAPQPVQGLRAQETPSGILLRWQPSPSPADTAAEVLLQRETLAPASNSSTPAAPLWLDTRAQTTGPQANQTLDTSAAEDTPFRYTAVRRQLIQLGQQTIDVRSSVSPAVDITWRNLFPPPAPTGLSAAPFMENGGFSVDLVWDPVEQPGLKGYLVTRQAIDSTGAPLGPAQGLTATAILLPAFHDATARPAARYRYSVTALGHKSTQSLPATVIVEPTTQ